MTSDKVTQKGLLALYAQQQQRCALTGREIGVDNIALDHIVPISQGGEHVLNNVWLVTRDANRMKGEMNLEDFTTTCVDVGRMHGHKFDVTLSA